MAAEAMMSEGGALRQPSQEESATALTRARIRPDQHAHDESAWLGMSLPLGLFFAGVGTDLVISLLMRNCRHKSLAH